MSYIVPNSTIYILEDIRFDKSYNDTICYSTDPTNLPQARAYQFNYYFSQFIKYTLQKQYYTRKERGWVRVNLPYECRILISCTLCRIQSNVMLFDKRSAD